MYRMYSGSSVFTECTVGVGCLQGMGNVEECQCVCVGGGGGLVWGCRGMLVGNMMFYAQ